MNDYYNILLYPSSEYYCYSFVVMLSALKTQNKPIHFWILQCDWNDAQKQRIISFIDEKSDNSEINIIDVDLELFSNNNFKTWGNHYQCYFKMLSPEVLPINEDRVLCVGIDTLFNKDIAEFYNTSFGYNLLAACTENPSRSFTEYDNYCIEKKMRYTLFNSDVVLLNLNGLRREGFSIEYVLNELKSLNGLDYMADQGLLNAMFYKQTILYPDYKYEFMIAKAKTYREILLEEFPKDHYAEVYQGEKSYDMEKAETIIHFAGYGIHKPWNICVENNSNDEIKVDYNCLPQNLMNHVDKFYIRWWKLLKEAIPEMYELIRIAGVNKSKTINQKNLDNYIKRLNQVLDLFHKISLIGIKKYDFFDITNEFRSKKIAVLKSGDMAGVYLIKLLNRDGVNIVFKSKKSSITALSEDELDKCREADLIINCCIYNGFEDEIIEDLRAISVYRFLGLQ